MKRTFFCFILFFACFNINPIFATKTAKVVGYLPTYRFGYGSRIDFCKITHLNLSFANPDKKGQLHIDDISKIMEIARDANPNIVICISLAGGGITKETTQTWSNLIDHKENRPAFIQNIVRFVIKNELDGVDVDLEWDQVTSGYSEFVVELSDALKKQNKLITAAFPNTKLFDFVYPEAIQAFDFINIMAYNERGAWDPTNPGQHSSIPFTEKGLKFWSDSMGVDSQKLTIGVPFYGFDFRNREKICSVKYGSMVNKNTEYAECDSVGLIYYNGRKTIEEKVLLAYREAAGIMIWELGQDAMNDYSLLNVIHDTYTKTATRTTGLCGNESLPVLDKKELLALNPHLDEIKVSFNRKTKKLKITSNNHINIHLYSILDETTVYSITGVNNQIYSDLTYLKTGTYFLKIENSDVVHQIIIE